MQVKLAFHGDVKVSTNYLQYWSRGVDGCFGHYKKAKLNIKADNRELAYAA